MKISRNWTNGSIFIKSVTAVMTAISATNNYKQLFST